MIKIVVREILVFVFSIAIFPATLMLLMLRGDLDRYGLMMIARELLTAGSSFLESILLIVARVLAPYALIQALRAYQWSRKGAEPKRWAYLYYAVLSGLVAVWFGGKSLDLFYFMFQLGDIPGELAQFLRLEYGNLLVGLFGIYGSIRCLRISLKSTQIKP
jgi:hypothetical protein